MGLSIYCLVFNLNPCIWSTVYRRISAKIVWRTNGNSRHARGRTQQNNHVNTKIRILARNVFANLSFLNLVGKTTDKKCLGM